MKKFLLFTLFFALCCNKVLAQELISLQKPTWAASENDVNGKSSNGNDGLPNTRWESKHLENQWWVVDLQDQFHIFRVEIDWENAYAKEYKIEVADNPDFSDAKEIAYVKDSPGKNEVVKTNIEIKGRYLRLYCIERKTGYGCSFWELRVYGTKQLKSVPVKLEVPYVQFIKLRLTPPDNNGQNEVSIQNNNGGTIVDLEFNEGAPLKIDLLDFRGNYDLDLWTYKAGTGEKINGIPFAATVYDGMVIHVELTERQIQGPQPPVADAGTNMKVYSPQNSVLLDGSESRDKDGIITKYLWEQINGPNDAVFENPNEHKTKVSDLIIGDYKFQLTVTDNDGLTDKDEIVVTVLPPEQIDFTLIYPENKRMVTDTRKPTLTWNSCPDATKYEVYVNITRDDYNWYVSGNLLDRYTKVGESSVNSFTLPFDLVDRWTYKWYVIASTPVGNKFSEKRQFGLYIPDMAIENDGINIIDGCRDLNKNGVVDPYENWRLTPEERLDDLLKRLSVKEKFQQLFYGGNDDPFDGFAFSYGVESGMREAQYNAAKLTPHGIPVAFLGDKIHGWKTIYPTQLGLAATRDMNLVYQCGNLHRVEQKSFGFTGTLAPLAEVSTKVLYPRIQEGGGENADEVAAMVRAIVCGMQGGPEINPRSMLVTVKHWPSQGAGGEGPTQYDEVTIKYHMKPWYATVDANAASVMPGYSSSPYLDPTGEGANTSKPITDFLRNSIEFKGFIVTDWLAANTSQSIRSISAGVDVLGGAPSNLTDVDELIDAVGIDRINEAAGRVLDVKIRLGMFENPYSDPTATWTNKEHHEIVLNAARKSVTLLKNDDLLPLNLNTGSEIVVGGPRATWESKLEDPNVIWQSIYYDNPQVKDYYNAIKDIAAEKGISVYKDNGINPQVAIVVIGENSYTHGTEWDDKNPNIPEDQLKVIEDFKEQGLKVVTIVILPRPYVLTPVIENSDAVLVVYRGGNGITQASAECIFGEYVPSGKLPFQIPISQDQIGTDDLKNQIEKWELPYDIGAMDYEREQIRGYIERDETVPPIFGNPLFQYGFGLENYGNEGVSSENNLFTKADKVKYTNPFDEFIKVDAKNFKIKYLRLHSIDGRLLINKNVENKIEIDTSNIRRGYYILSVLTDNGVFIYKVLKK